MTGIGAPWTFYSRYTKRFTMRTLISVPRSSRCLGAMLALVWTVTGCQPAQDPLVLRARSELIVSNIAEPTSSIEEVIASASGTESSSGTESVEESARDSKPVVLKAKIGSGKGETFDPATSAFLVSEIPAGEHANEASHDASNCPFCRAREAKAPTVLVRLVNKDGQPFAKPADQLLGLSNGQHVIVKGKGHFDSELNFYTLEAEGIQILK